MFLGCDVKFLIACISPALLITEQFYHFIVIDKLL